MVQLPLLDDVGDRVLDTLQESGEADATLDYGEDGCPIPSTTGAGEGGEETSGIHPRLWIPQLVDRRDWAQGIVQRGTHP